MEEENSSNLKANVPLEGHGTFCRVLLEAVVKANYQAVYPTRIRT